jgi:hypothetical protein
MLDPLGLEPDAPAEDYGDRMFRVRRLDAMMPMSSLVVVVLVDSIWEAIALMWRWARRRA